MKKPVLILVMIKGIIFDFDGVITESVHIKSAGFSEIYKPYGPATVKKVVKHHEANGGMSRFKKIKFYHKTFLNTSLSNQEINHIANQFSEYVVDRVVNAQYVPDALEFIKHSYGNYKLFISTGTPTTEIKKILKLKKIMKYFKSVYGSPALKNDHVKVICSEYNLKSDELIFFGDSKTDMEAAAANGIKFILRLNVHNKQFFQDYRGHKICNFKSLDISSIS